MSLYDKYSIIENHLKDENIKIITSKIENYFENYLSSDIKVLVPEYIEQSIYFNKINLGDLKINIQLSIKNYLIQRRNNFRIFIKKEKLELSDITKFLKNFISKIQYINNIINIDHELIKYTYSMLNNLIISDSIILIFIEEQVITFNKDIKELLLFIKKLDCICFDNMFIKTIKLFGGMYKKKIINNESLPIPINYRRLQKLNNTIKYYHTINIFYYTFIKETSELNFTIFKLILEDLIEIIKNNSLEEIEYTFTKNCYFLINIKNYNFDEKQSLITNIADELIIRCSTANTLNDIKIILKFGKFSSEILKTKVYNKYPLFIAKMSQTIINFFKPDENEHKVIHFINNFINESIINRNRYDAVTAVISSHELNNFDLFINSYYDLLVKRLTNNLSLKASEFEYIINIEKEMITYLTKIKKTSLIYKVNKVINDIYTSYYENLEFNNLSNKLLSTNISVITTSYNNWTINQSEGLVDHNIIDQLKDTQFGKYLKYYELYYIEKYNNHRIINWFLHFGEISITYLDQPLKMLPIQFIIVEMFSKVDEILIHEIINSKLLINYSDKFKTDILNSIISSGLLIINDQKVILSKSNSIKNDLIEIFLNTSDYPNIWEKQKETELAHSRNEIINTVINHILKTCSKSKSELYSIVNKEIKLFKLDEELFEKSLKYLIEMDYIILNDKNEYEKLF